MKKFLLISGVSGSGKNYIEKELAEFNHPKVQFHKMTQVTTREKREGEDNSIYNFLTEKEYKNIYDQLIAKTNFLGNSYGTLDSSKLKDYNGKLTINTIIVNRLGYDNVVEDLAKKYGNDFDLVLININNPDPVSRNSRDEEFIKNEMNRLKEVVDIYIDNSKDNWATPNDILNKLFQYEFIYELESLT